MKNIFDQDRDGAGKTAIRLLKEKVSNSDGYRTAIQEDIVTGDVTMLRTKGGENEVTITRKPKKKKELPSGDRTFVFKIFGAEKSIVSNRNGSGLLRVGGFFETGNAAYVVLPTKSSTASDWRDVLRLDSTKRVVFNNKPIANQKATEVSYSPNYLLSRSAAHGVQNAFQMMLHSSGTKGYCFVVIGEDGKVKSIEENIEGDFKIHLLTSNFSLQPDGSFVFYQAIYAARFDSIDRIMGITTRFTRVRPTNSFPFFTIERGENKVMRDSKNSYPSQESEILRTGVFYKTNNDNRELDFAIEKSALVTLSAAGTAYKTINELSQFSGSIPTGHDFPMIAVDYPVDYAQTTVSGIAERNVIEDNYGYPGSGLNMKLTGSLVSEVSFFGKRDKGAIASFNLISQTTGELLGTFSERIIGESASDTISLSYNRKVNVSVEVDRLPKKPYSYAAGEVWKKETRYAVRSGYIVKARVLSGITDWYREPVIVQQQGGASLKDDRHRWYKITTVDYIYADIEENVYITFEMKFSATCTGSLVEKTIVPEYVVSVRGTEYRFPVVFDEPEDKEYFINDYSEHALSGLGNYTLDSYNPPPVFNPSFMNQGNCPFIAYTTKAEEAAGATPEFYLDMLVAPSMFYGSYYTDYSTVTNSTRWISPVVFYPAQFHMFFLRWIQAANSSGNVINRSAWGEKLFPSNRAKYRLQVCNGVKGPWSRKLGEEFAGDPILDISRI